MNTTIDRDALAALLIEHPEETRAQVRMTGLSEAILIHMVATKLDEFQFAQWWDARHVGGNATVGPDMRPDRKLRSRIRATQRTRGNSL